MSEAFLGSHRTLDNGNSVCARKAADGDGREFVVIEFRRPGMAAKRQLLTMEAARALVECLEDALSGVCECRGCGIEIRWEKTPANKWTPVNLDGTPHWGTCPKAKDFKKAKS